MGHTVAKSYFELKRSKSLVDDSVPWVTMPQLGDACGIDCKVVNLYQQKSVNCLAAGVVSLSPQAQTCWLLTAEGPSLTYHTYI